MSVSSPPPVLLAAALDWLEGVLPVLFVGFWILSQVFAVFRRVAGGPARPPVVREPAPPRGPADAPRPAAEPRAELERQIAEFLREASGARPTERPARTAPAPQAAIKGQAAPPAHAVRPEHAAPEAPPPRAAPAPRRDDDRRVGTLAARPSAVARHVQDAFAHDLGRLHSGLDMADAAAAPRPAAAVALARLARDPATIRQAVLLREILERPVDRWEPSAP